MQETQTRTPKPARLQTGAGRERDRDGLCEVGDGMPTEIWPSRILSLSPYIPTPRRPAGDPSPRRRHVPLSLPGDYQTRLCGRAVLLGNRQSWDNPE